MSSADKNHGAKSRPDSNQALEWLEALAEDHARLSELDAEELKRLRNAAGKISFPDRAERRNLARKRRRELRESARNKDDAALNATSNRAMKRALRFPVAPAALPMAAESRELLERQNSLAGSAREFWGPKNSLAESTREFLLRQNSLAESAREFWGPKNSLADSAREF